MNPQRHELGDSDIPLHKAVTPYIQNLSRSHMPRLSFRQPVTYLSLILLGAGVAIGGERVLQSQKVLAESQTAPALNQPITPTTVARSPISLQANFVMSVVEQAGPATVRIDATRTVATGGPDTLDDPFFRRFFGSQGPNPGSRETREGVGSGFIISADGQILTNAHVVDGADEVTVTLKDGRTLTGKVVGVDSVTDVAVIKIQANQLPTVRLANSDQLQPGEWAIAIGNPLGLDNTVTTGIVSATGRRSGQVGAPDKRVSYIQTDAAINPGNSGGPLLNAQGEVIGMNTAIIRGAQGIGFAIPINTAQRIAQQLIATGKADHRYLGIQMVELTPNIKQQLNQDPNSGISVNEDQGILVVRVMPNSPAAKAGLRAGDVIQSLNGQTVKDSQVVQDTVERSKQGESIQLQVRRQGRTLDLAVQPGALASQDS
jgi:Do/DeqQ family serine protease